MAALFVSSRTRRLQWDMRTMIDIRLEAEGRRYPRELGVERQHEAQHCLRIRTIMDEQHPVPA